MEKERKINMYENYNEMYEDWNIDFPFFFAKRDTEPIGLLAIENLRLWLFD